MRRRGSVALLLLLVLAGCTDGPDRAPGAAPAACDLVTASEVQNAIGAPVSGGAQPDSPDRCRYVSDRRDEVEITVDRPAVDGAVRTYRALNPDAQAVEGIGDEGAMRSGTGTGELVFVKGPRRFFVVITGPSSSSEALLVVARAAVGRM